MMNKYEMSVKIARRVGVDQLVARQIVQMTLDAMIEALAAEGSLELRDFGVFEVWPVKAHRARNPKTGALVMVPERRRVHFKMGKVIEERISNGAAPAG
jgi:integration host factor subunit beta